ncbi:hypothetical protein [Pseudoalteromonas luteoviolacea]|uniref:Peptidase M61 catalytic domain-containing protein n=1 Tax=Pseudoalteromonas luteoviolacea S4054 TaxID=1129367 RepID=A0A0F6AA21_9GAMM|nr:hypothetical protein [Pseudoalteromonas luteoviolacea]AOT07332.1 hypothetical protein S4054249_05520 [Pseudoalteromonas luteoviolacea]AOT12247.1 hypothetical protein S40542_05520 [Pseudoalteromonas luteoviolacea]AOT17160.1 hypothetical protein S4054_05520 [Pseudoalteromonas luteoviolacea]KKE83042.1 hypothetical protein N479_01655 [Pseudoalteromonas luteoviolacea S4054]KZN72389.1 hypothetical protein N481_15860 [Pseudoalteromonas luteoviolacea S4047-1]
MRQICRCGFVICLASFSLSVFGADIEIVWQHGQTPNKHTVEKVKNWLEYGLKQTASTLTDLQQPIVPVFIHLNEHVSEPVPWGEVSRGEHDGITLHINKHASLTQLKVDWTLYHEFVHLYHPFFGYGDSWLGEGLATYLQNIVMLQAGILSKRNFVQRVTEGLDRGEAATAKFKGRLSNVAENMWQLRAYQRVYWSGVAFFIEAEERLKVAGSQYNLAKLLAIYQTCCRGNITPGTHHTSVQFLSALDSIAKVKVFMSLYEKYSEREDFPAISDRQILNLSTQYSSQ